MPLVTRSSDYTLVLTESGSRLIGDEAPFVIHFCLRQRRRASAAPSRRSRGMRIVGEYYFEFEDMNIFRGDCPLGHIAVRDMLSVLEFGEVTGRSHWVNEFSSALDDAVSLALSRRWSWLSRYVADFNIEVFPTPQELTAGEGMERWLVVRGSLHELGLGSELPDEVEDGDHFLEFITGVYSDDLGRATGVTTCAICLDDFSGTLIHAIFLVYI